MAKRLIVVFLMLPFVSFSKSEYLLYEISDAIYEDTANTILSPNQLKASLRISERIKEYRNEKAAYWFHFVVDNPEEKWVVEGYDFTTDVLALFYKEEGVWKEKIVGASLPYQERFYDILNLAIDIPIIQPEPTEYFLKLYSHDGPSFKVYLKAQTSFTNYAINENTSLGFFYGILMIIALYNLVLFVYLKERNHLFLALYIFSSILYSFKSDAFGFKFIWSSYPELNVWMDYLWSPILFITCYSVYAIDFLKLDKKHPILFYGLIGVVGLTISLMFVEFFLPFDLTFLSDLYLLPIICFFIISIYTYYQGNIYNRFFILGNGVVFISIFISILRERGVIEGNILSVYSFDFAICSEILLLSLALADRISFLKVEKENAKDELIAQLERNQSLQTKVNRELESKVEERTGQLQAKTVELVDKNEELNKLTEKLNEMNSKLDYDNWKLNKNIETETLARLKGTDVSFEEFRRVFTDDLFCLRYLRDLKWKDTFSCVKCDHSNYKEIDNHYGRKCSKCGHIESVTSNTLLHRTRIAPLKAFYIGYVVYYNLKLTNEELALTLDLTENTCWRYRKKIKELNAEKFKTWEAFLVL